MVLVLMISPGERKRLAENTSWAKFELPIYAIPF
ncbi:hypothetical protein SLEP1_g56780 [Rubroshorea leprosula]|uniref:Uncharacterized protein n=1 Tax=Rubroshorea leprosula TaxID=152421 RepID=A0AAV5HP44_9ROSI|nr:hypothetical protein SLEP1_g2555 [Rubroshorea leprosula]GKV50064.1 hypothetical protein SLEP1_g56780 [Rubroshorea leprosula]